MSLDKETEVIQLDPNPGFVVKTKILESQKLGEHPIFMKVFINVCHDLKVPKPKVDFDPNIVFPMIINNEWEIPLIVSKEKRDKDKKGQDSLVYDCCINSLSFQWVQVNKDLKSILIEWCLEAVELLYDIVLERNYTTPKMLAKGILSHTVIKSDDLDESGFQKKLQRLKENEAQGLLEELKDDDDVQMNDDELPPLMGIGGKKPLIEEIDDIKPRPKNKVHSSLEKPSTDEKTNIDYKVMFEKLQGDYSLLVKITAPSLTSNSLKISYVPKTNTLIAKSLDTDKQFPTTSQGVLKIPVPDHVARKPGKPFRCFHIESDKKFYVYL